jgi:molybdopterin-binding protein
VELELAGVHHRYGGNQSLRGLDLRVAGGEVHAVMGPTGCGKTTALRLAGLLARPVTGEVRFDGRPVPAKGRARLGARRRTAMVHQEPALLRGTVRHNVAWGLRARGVRGAELTARTDAALARLQLEDLAGRNHDELSGGERKRTALAAALAVQPEILLLDEPLSSTHPALRQRLREHIAAINRDLGVTILVATHDIQDALALAGALTVMDQGATVQAGPVDEVLHRPRCAFVAEFAGGANLLRVDHSDGAVCRVGGLAIQAPAPVAPGSFLTISPGHVLLGLTEPAISARNRFQGIITAMRPFDYGFLVTVACAGTAIAAVVTRGSVDELGLAPGREVWLYFKVSAVRSLG